MMHFKFAVKVQSSEYLHRAYFEASVRDIAVAAEARHVVQVQGCGYCVLVGSRISACLSKSSSVNPQRSKDWVTHGYNYLASKNK